MLRTGKTWQYRREAAPIAEEDSNSTARLRPVQDVSIMLQDRRPFLRDHFVFRFEKPPDLSPRIDWSGHQSNRFTACRWRFALTPENARHSAPLIRLDAGTGRTTSPDAPTKSRELRGSVGMQECFRDITQHILCVTLRSFIP
jgi:hypothetical protein